MVASASVGFLSSITPSGSPFTNSTTSGRRSILFSTTVNWLTACQSLLAGSSKSMTRACAPRTLPPSRYSTVTPSTTMRWNARLRASSVAPSGWVSRRTALPSASPGNSGLSRPSASRNVEASTTAL